VPIVLGVGLSSYSDSSFHVLGFLAAATSNFMFSLRALHAKQLRRLHGVGSGLDDLHLFYRISRFGCSLIIPIALLFEGVPIYRLLTGSSTHAAAAVGGVPLDQPGAPLEDGSQAGGGSLAAEVIGDVVRHLLVEPNTSGTGGDETDSSRELRADPSLGQAGAQVDHQPPVNMWSIFLAVLVNGVCYCTYNQTSFIVLGRVPFVTHATLNVMRRVFIIGFTSWWFMTPMNTMNIFGIALALTGFSLFIYLKVGLRASQNLPR